MVVPCAQLRVFVPTDTLAPRDRERWGSDTALGHLEARHAEEHVARLRLLTGRGSLPDGAVLVRRMGEQRFVCPLQYDLRSAAGLRQLRGEVPAPVLDLLFPDGELRSRLDVLASTRRVTTVVDAAWAVPLPWFVLYADDERRFLDPPDGPGPRLLYVTTIATALGRLERAVDALDGVIEDADAMLEELADLAGWLESFDPRSLVELDYAGLTRLLDRDRLRADRSAHDVWSAIEGLESGDLMAAVAYYGALRGRWSGLRAQLSAS